MYLCLERPLKALRAGDVLVVWRLDRLGRNLPDLVRIVGELESGKVGLESITENIETVRFRQKLTHRRFSQKYPFSSSAKSSDCARRKNARPDQRGQALDAHHGRGVSNNCH